MQNFPKIDNTSIYMSNLGSMLFVSNPNIIIVANCNRSPVLRKNYVSVTVM